MYIYICICQFFYIHPRLSHHIYYACRRENERLSDAIKEEMITEMQAHDLKSDNLIQLLSRDLQVCVCVCVCVCACVTDMFTQFTCARACARACACVCS